MSDELDRMKTEVDEEGIMMFVDKMTEKKKKNRYRHVKDGCPKKERGKRNAGTQL